MVSCHPSHKSVTLPALPPITSAEAVLLHELKLREAVTGPNSIMLFSSLLGLVQLYQVWHQENEDAISSFAKGEAVIQRMLRILDIPAPSLSSEQFELIRLKAYGAISNFYQFRSKVQLSLDFMLKALALDIKIPSTRFNHMIVASELFAMLGIACWRCCVCIA